MHTIDCDNCVNSLSETTAPDESLYDSSADLLLAFIQCNLIACSFDCERELNLGPKYCGNFLQRSWVLHLFACDQCFNCFSKPPPSHKAHNHLFCIQLFASFSDRFFILLFSQNVCLLRELSNLLVGESAVLGARLFVGETSHLNHTKNELSELSAADETLYHFDTF
jgi:hypothetical protein